VTDRNAAIAAQIITDNAYANSAVGVEETRALAIEADLETRLAAAEAWILSASLVNHNDDYFFCVAYLQHRSRAFAFNVNAEWLLPQV